MHTVSLFRGSKANHIRRMARDDPLIPDQLLSANEDLYGSTALGVFKAVVEALTDEGLGVIVNDHVTKASWCGKLGPA